ATRGSKIDAGEWETYFGKRRMGIEEWNGCGERTFLLLGQLLPRSLDLAYQILVVVARESAGADLRPADQKVIGQTPKYEGDKQVGKIPHERDFPFLIGQRIQPLNVIRGTLDVKLNSKLRDHVHCRSPRVPLGTLPYSRSAPRLRTI